MVLYRLIQSERIGDERNDAFNELRKVNQNYNNNNDGDDDDNTHNNRHSYSIRYTLPTEAAYNNQVL